MNCEVKIQGSFSVSFGERQISDSQLSHGKVVLWFLIFWNQQKSLQIISQTIVI